eukprot:1350860-Amphidinium_carterae.3
MPNASESSIDSTAGSLIDCRSALLGVSVNLRAKTGFQASKISGHFVATPATKTRAKSHFTV